MNLEKISVNQNKDLDNRLVIGDIKQSVLDLIKFKDYALLDSEKIKHQANLIEKRIRELESEFGPEDEEIKDLKDLFESFSSRI